jgi:hypothetical protein
MVRAENAEKEETWEKSMMVGLNAMSMQAS